MQFAPLLVFIILYWINIIDVVMSEQMPVTLVEYKFKYFLLKCEVQITGNAPIKNVCTLCDICMSN